MDDIAPVILEEVQQEFSRLWKENNRVKAMWSNIRNGNSSYELANNFAIQVGEMLAKSYKKYITADALPEGKMWYNIATRVLYPTLKDNYDLISVACKTAQEVLNKTMGVGLGIVTPEFNNDRYMGIINKIANAENFDDIAWMLDDPIVNFSQSIVDEFIQQNAESHYNLGLTPKIRRSVNDRNACKWCINLAGVYDYPDVPQDVYRKHENCRCIVEYISDGKRQNVHAKTEQSLTPAQRQQLIDEYEKQLRNS